MSFILYILCIDGAPQKKLPKSRGQHVRETLKIALFLHEA